MPSPVSISPTSMSPQSFAQLVGTPGCPLPIDVRTDEDFAADPRLVPGARRRPATAAADWAAEFAGHDTVVICQKGLKLSAGAAAWLRREGARAATLEGGMQAWTAAGLPAVPVAALPRPDARGRTVWVTRERPKIDRIACPWLIRRFVDPDAVFLYVPTSEVAAVAERFAATPYDIEGVFWSHRDERCTFDTMIEAFGLTGPALSRLAAIVRGADTARLEIAPESAGLLAASLGLSHMFADDLQQLEAGMTLYDAFYRWCRDASHETHNWPAKPAGARP